MAKLFAAEHRIAKIKKAMHDVNTEMMKNHELKDTPLKKLLQYEPVLEQTEQILYWFSQREKSSVFKNIFQQKLLGLQGKLVFTHILISYHIIFFKKNEIYNDVYRRLRMANLGS